MSEEKHTPIFLAIKTALAKRDEDAVCGVGEWRTGMFCGLEDRNITDRYDACEYGYEKALDRVDEWILKELDDLIDQACKSHKALVDALEEIAKGEGAFNRDQQVFAENTITSMRTIAEAALALAKKK